jgi:hypothetical protein
MPQICDMGQTALPPLWRKACWGFFRPKNPTASTGFEPAILGTREYSMSHYNISNFTPPSVSTEQLFSCHQTSSTLPTMHGSFSFIHTIYKACLFIKHCSYLLTCLASIFMPSFNTLICTACLWTETEINTYINKINCTINATKYNLHWCHDNF